MRTNQGLENSCFTLAKTKIRTYLYLYSSTSPSITSSFSPTSTSTYCARARPGGRGVVSDLTPEVLSPDSERRSLQAARDLELSQRFWPFFGHLRWAFQPTPPFSNSAFQDLSTHTYHSRWIKTFSAKFHCKSVAFRLFFGQAEVILEVWTPDS